MIVDIRPIEDLKLRLSNPGAKPVSFLVGAPLSWADGNGVPAVNEFVAIVRERLSRAGVAFEQALTKRLSGAEQAKRYQEAMSVVYDVLDADAATEIVRSAVLNARKATAPEFDFSRKNDGDPNDWHIPRGVTGLARLINASPDRFPGPIFTTNFDPLIGLALNNLGIRAQCFAIPLDGSIDAVISSKQDQVNVFHIHGYWRDSPTLHMPQQLTFDRPQLRTSLETHLNDTNLLVVAYSGWDDVFTTALANCFNNSSFKGLVTWCFYSKNSAELREQNQALFKKFQNGIGQGRISFYFGVDCHSFFDDLVGNFGISAEQLTVTDSSPLVGCEQGLRALAGTSSRDARIERLIRAAWAQDVNRGEGSFFGGLLETRFSSAALTDHLVAPMAPLRNRDVPGGRGSLYDALIYIATCHSAQVPGLDKRVLAVLLEVPAQRVTSSVVRALGRELGIAETVMRVFTRHRRAADALIVAAEQSFDTDLCDIWRSLVEMTAKIGRSLKKSKTDQLLGTDFHGAIVHVGSKLYRNLPIAIDETRRGKIGIAAAEAACAHQPEWLGIVTDLARAHRFAGNFDEATKVMRGNLRNATKKRISRLTSAAIFMNGAYARERSVDTARRLPTLCLPPCRLRTLLSLKSPSKMPNCPARVWASPSAICSPAHQTAFLPKAAAP